MKAGCFILATIATLCFANAQTTTWCPPGAQWHYGYGSFLTNGFIKLTYVGDTVYNGQACHLLDQYIKYVTYPTNIISESHQDVFTFESGGIVYGAVPSLSDWDTIYNYNAVPGDAWGTFPESGFRLVVQDTGHKTINGYDLKFMTVGLTDTLWNLVTDTVYERVGFGHMLYPFNMQISTDPDYNGLCNYSDDAFADWNLADSACTVLYLGINDASRVNLAIFPNPFTDRIKITGAFSTNPISVKLFSPAGQLVFETATTDGAVDLSELANGLYFIAVESHQGVFRERLIKRDD